MDRLKEAKARVETNNSHVRIRGVVEAAMAEDDNRLATSRHRQHRQREERSRQQHQDEFAMIENNGRRVGKIDRDHR
jgi:hypothetical protein